MVKCLRTILARMTSVSKLKAPSVEDQGVSCVFYYGASPVWAAGLIDYPPLNPVPISWHGCPSYCQFFVEHFAVMLVVWPSPQLGAMRWSCYRLWGPLCKKLLKY
ncbi:hypothetical protein KY285_026193 [Solanum tuberosum]|nr:hypothetical protein KY285_026193 [Solanum tuberosum]